MKISLCIIRNWLSHYHPELKTTRVCNKAKCSEDCLQIREVRLYNKKECNNKTVLYVGRKCDFFDSNSQNIVCHYTESDLLLDTKDLFEVFNEILEAFAYYSCWCERMMRKIEQQCTLSELLDLSEPILNNPLMVLDSTHFLIAVTTKYMDEHVDDSWDHLISKNYAYPDQTFYIHAKENNRYQKETEPYLIGEEIFPRNTYSQNIFLDGAWCGVLIMAEYEHDFSISDTHLFRILGDYVQAWMERQSKDAYSKNETMLLQDVLEGRVEKTDDFFRVIDHTRLERSR